MIIVHLVYPRLNFDSTFVLSFCDARAMLVRCSCVFRVFKYTRDIQQLYLICIHRLILKRMEPEPIVCRLQ